MKPAKRHLSRRSRPRCGGEGEESALIMVHGEWHVHGFEFFGLNVAGDVGQKLSKVRKKFRGMPFEWRMQGEKGLRGEEVCKIHESPKNEQKAHIIEQGHPKLNRQRVWPQKCTKEHKKGSFERMNRMNRMGSGERFSRR